MTSEMIDQVRAVLARHADIEAAATPGPFHNCYGSIRKESDDYPIAEVEPLLDWAGAERTKEEFAAEGEALTESRNSWPHYRALLLALLEEHEARERYEEALYAPDEIPADGEFQSSALHCYKSLFKAKRKAQAALAAFLEACR